MVGREVPYATRRNFGHDRTAFDCICAGVRRYVYCVCRRGRFVATKFLSKNGPEDAGVHPRLCSRGSFAASAYIMDRYLMLDRLMLQCSHAVALAPNNRRQRTPRLRLVCIGRGRRGAAAAERWAAHHSKHEQLPPTDRP